MEDAVCYNRLYKDNDRETAKETERGNTERGNRERGNRELQQFEF